MHTHVHPRHHHRHHGTELVRTSRNFLVTFYGWFFFFFSLLFLSCFCGQSTGPELYPPTMFQSRHFCLVSDRHSVTSGLENVSTWCDCNFVTLQSQCPLSAGASGNRPSLLCSCSSYFRCLRKENRTVLPCDSLTSGSLMASKFIHTVANKISSFPRLQDTTVHVFLLFCPVCQWASGLFLCFGCCECGVQTPL